MDITFEERIEKRTKKIIEGLRSSSTTTLDLKYNYLGNEGCKEIAKILPQTSISTLVLTGNHIRDEGVKELAKVLPQTSITTLGLICQWISDEGRKELAKALPKTSITTLDLSNNKIGYEGAKELAKALPKTSITKLDLTFNHIRGEGAKELAKTLPQTSSITTLDLNFNEIGDAGAKELAKALSQTSITTLILEDNDIGDEGAKELAKALPKTSISTLNLKLNEIGDEGFKEISKALPETSITTLSVKNLPLLTLISYDRLLSAVSLLLHPIDLQVDNVVTSSYLNGMYPIYDDIFSFVMEFNVINRIQRFKHKMWNRITEYDGIDAVIRPGVPRRVDVKISRAIKVIEKEYSDTGNTVFNSIIQQSDLSGIEWRMIMRYVGKKESCLGYIHPRNWCIYIDSLQRVLMHVQNEYDTLEEEEIINSMDIEEYELYTQVTEAKCMMMVYWKYLDKLLSTYGKLKQNVRKIKREREV